MKVEPSDYLNELNFEIDEPEYQLPYEENSISNSDLDLFSKADFFNLDDFNLKKDYIDPSSQSLDINKQYVGEHEANMAANLEAASGADVSPNSATQISPSSGESDSGDYKRKRNTAASARFRIKKKLKEQQMEARTKELQEKVTSLETKLMTVEMENKCLKQLILKKNEDSNMKLLDSIKKRSITNSKPLFEYTN